ncbi:papain fold toxin domain-containing protein [Sorangium sp. So ce321]|uniref:papain fold toxin domain-containing protein n=1 Tax=Sorangium sp. So ce321 TaxID=3133300 RepID=UPI003F610F0B
MATAQRIAGKISGSLKCFGRCADFANVLQKGLQKQGVSGTRIEIQVGKGITPYSNKFGALAERGRGHTAVRVGDAVFDNFRPGGVPYSEFIDDLGGSDFFGTPFVNVIEIAF